MQTFHHIIHLSENYNVHTRTRNNFCQSVMTHKTRWQWQGHQKNFSRIYSWLKNGWYEKADCPFCLISEKFCFLSQTFSIETCKSRTSVGQQSLIAEQFLTSINILAGVASLSCISEDSCLSGMGTRSFALSILVLFVLIFLFSFIV